jgi:hypothetical protein
LSDFDHMVEVFRSLKAAEIWIYLVIGVCAVFPLRNLFISIREYRGSLFGMEKENARAKLVQAASLLGFLLIMAAGVFIFITFAGSVVPALALLPTPTLNLQGTETPVNAMSVGIATQIGTQAPGTAANGCIPGQLEWTDPKPGAEIGGKVELRGTVNITDLGFYKYEYSQDNSHWMTIQAGTTVVTNGLIGNWDTAALTPGDYTIRLVVSDNKGAALAPCLISVKVVQK